MLVGKRVCAALVAASLVLAEARPAAAIQPNYDGPAVATGALSFAVTLTPLMILALMSSKKAEESRTGLEITLYVTGISGLALAGTTFGLEAATDERCTKDCRGAVIFGGFGAGFAALSLVGAAMFSYERTHPKRKTRAWVMPTPVVIDAIGGPTIGAGVTGVAF